MAKLAGLFKSRKLAGACLVCGLSGALEKRARGSEFIPQRATSPGIFRPIDDLEQHSPLEHFGLESGRVLFPLRCLADTEPSFLALLLERVVDGKRSAYAFIHHRKAFAREDLIVRAPLLESRQ